MGKGKTQQQIIWAIRWLASRTILQRRNQDTTCFPHPPIVLIAGAGFSHPLPMWLPQYLHISSYLLTTSHPPLRENRDFPSFKLLRWHLKPVFWPLEVKIFMLTTGNGSEELVGMSCKGKGWGHPSNSPLLWRLWIF